jgi:hypothetical protein
MSKMQREEGMICAPAQFDPAAQTYQPMVQISGCKKAKSALIRLVKFDFARPHREKSCFRLRHFESEGRSGRTRHCSETATFWIKEKRMYCSSLEVRGLGRFIYLHDANTTTRHGCEAYFFLRSKKHTSVIVACSSLATCPILYRFSKRRKIIFHQGVHFDSREKNKRSNIPTPIFAQPRRMVTSPFREAWTSPHHPHHHSFSARDIFWNLAATCSSTNLSLILGPLKLTPSKLRSVVLRAADGAHMPSAFPKFSNIKRVMVGFSKEGREGRNT